MAQTPPVLYLPPGVVPPPGSPREPAGPGAPFDRSFFESVLPQAVGAFCTQVKCEMPVVELRTVDGATHFVTGISGVSDLWVALHTSSVDHDHPVQVFLPYQTIFRVEIHPESDSRRGIGFHAAPTPPPAE